MSVHLGTLYHWSPKRRRESILENGLKVMQEAHGTEAAFPWVCCGTTPSSAWGLLPGSLKTNEAVMDLWQVQVEDEDKLDILTWSAPMIREVRIQHGLPVDRLWWVAEREQYAHDSIGR
jgi:hypothetical protein